MNTALYNGRGAIFDLDGTLLDTLEDLADAGNYVLKKHGFSSVPSEGFRYYVGNGMRNMVRLMLGASLQLEQRNVEVDDDLISAMLEDASAYYLDNWHNKTKLYAGIDGLLKEMAARRIPFAVCSNKADAFVKKMIRYYFSGTNFAGMLGEQDGMPRKPDPAGALQMADAMRLRPNELVFIGDTRIDMQTANSAGMFAVGVSWGFRPVEELQENGAKLIVNEPREILRCFG